MTTGSIGNNYSSSRLQSIIKELSGDINPEDGPPPPIYEIKGKGYVWCFSPSKKTMIRIARGEKIYILDKVPDENNKLLIFAPYDIVYINKEEVQEVGYN